MNARSAWLLATLFAACADGGDAVPGNECGDEIRSGSEQCDDGNTTSGDGCDSTCRSETNPLCGNGLLNPGELCDDRNFQDNDGCTSCVPDEGFTCSGEPSVCVDGSIGGPDGGLPDAAMPDAPMPDMGGGGGPFPPTLDQVVINEVLVNAAATDSNCDGTVDVSKDEYIELVNDSSTPKNLTNMTLHDGVQLRHTFTASSSANLMLMPGQSIVVWGGGEPDCPGVSNWQVASTGTLGLSNTGGETVSLKSGNTTISTVTFPSSTAGVSQNRSPDIAGSTFANHDTITGAGTRKVSPGRRVDGSAFPN